jgi:hypothetical protein
MKQIILDGVTYNLMPVDKKPASSFHVSAKEMSWAQAKVYADNLGLRLLQSEELHVLVRDGHLPVKEGWAWSSSSVSDYTSLAWYVYLGNGLTYTFDKANTNRAVCVPVDFSLEKFLAEKNNK